jgi:predicted AlkP superfamily phosphohydrolase/phosphomutase
MRETIQTNGQGGHPTRRVVVIGLDSADADLIDRWCQEGHLPVMRSLREQGVWGRLGTTADRLHVSGWPSFYTGTTPDKHGLYHAYVMKPGDQLPQRPRADETPEPFFWKLLSDAGKRCVVMDAFMNCPLKEFNGAQILEYGTWTWFWEPMTTPPALRDEIVAKFGPYPAEDHSKVLSPPDCAGFRERLVKGAQKKAEVVGWLMEREPWDFFLVIFGESHPAGHYFWHLHDPSYPAHPPDGAGPLAVALRDVYAAIDDAIGTILASVDERTTVLVVSADGMGPNYSGSHLLEQMLKQLGLFVTADGDPGSTGGGPAISAPLAERGGTPAARRKPAASGKRDLAKRIRNLVPSRLRIAVSRYLLPHKLKERLTIRWMTADIVWSRCRAFLINNANEGYVRINLKGREPQGIVAPGAEYETLCDSLVAALRGLVNPRTGRPAVRAVWRVDQVYAGPYRDRLPDIVVNWDPSAELTTELVADACGLVKTAKAQWEMVPYYTGNHAPAAFVIARGPGIPRGEELSGAHILDLAPTLLAYFGLEKTSSMDGKAIADLLP